MLEDNMVLDWFQLKWYTIKEYWYQFKCWAWNRETTYKPRYLPHTWVDKVEVLPHLMFEVLLRFLEDEKPETHVQWYGAEGPKVTFDGQVWFVLDEMKRLAKWWREEYNDTKRMDTLWAIVEKNIPVREFLPITQENYKDLNCNESSIGYFLWEPQWDNADKKAIHDGAMKDIHKFEDKTQRELEENMVRLVKIRGHLWC